MEKYSWLDLQSGSELAWKNFYQSERSRFIGYALHRFQVEEADALDIFQQAFLAFWERVDQGKLVLNRANPETYLFSVGRFMLIQHKKKLNQLSSISLDMEHAFYGDQQEETFSGVDSETALWAEEYKKESMWQEGEVGADLQKYAHLEATHLQESFLKMSTAFSKLGVACKDLLRRIFYEGKTPAELVEAGWYASTDVVKTQKSRCLKQIRTWYEESVDPK